MNFTPVLNAILRRRNARSRNFDANSSSFGTNRGSASTTVTSAPKLLNTDANSTPMTPPPRITIRSGTESSRMASLLVMIRPPMSSPGSVLA